MAQARAQRAQAAAQLSSSQKHVVQTQANLNRQADILDKYNTTSPIDGVVTNLPVRVGETMVTGIQNSPGSTIMTIADMSVITAEVKVDETDIVNVVLGQLADVTIDAIPNRTFKGHVIEIGNTAILRSTGVAASQSTTSSQEAKDFKVVIGLDNPPEEIRPGLSCTGKITTATRQKALTIPIQALTVRQKGDLEEKKPGQERFIIQSRRGKSEERRSPGRLRDQRRQGRVPQSRYWHYGRHRYRGNSRVEGRRRDYNRKLQGDPHHAQSYADQNRQQNAGQDRNVIT